MYSSMIFPFWRKITPFLPDCAKQQKEVYVFNTLLLLHHAIHIHFHFQDVASKPFNSFLVGPFLTTVIGIIHIHLSSCAQSHQPEITVIILLTNWSLIHKWFFFLYSSYLIFPYNFFLFFILFFSPSCFPHITLIICIHLIYSFAQELLFFLLFFSEISLS